MLEGTAYYIIGAAVVSAGAGAFGRELVVRLMGRKSEELGRNGRDGKNGKNGDSFTNCPHHSDIRELVTENQTTQKLMLQRMEQTDKRLKEGNGKFEKLYEITNAQILSLELLKQNMEHVDRRVLHLEARDE